MFSILAHIPHVSLLPTQITSCMSLVGVNPRDNHIYSSLQHIQSLRGDNGAENTEKLFLCRPWARKLGQVPHWSLLESKQNQSGWDYTAFQLWSLWFHYLKKSVNLHNEIAPEIHQFTKKKAKEINSNKYCSLPRTSTWFDWKRKLCTDYTDQYCHALKMTEWKVPCHSPPSLQVRATSESVPGRGYFYLILCKAFGPQFTRFKGCQDNTAASGSLEQGFLRTLASANQFYPLWKYT